MAKKSKDNTVTTAPNRWLIHSYRNRSRYVEKNVALDLIRKYDGSYCWLNNICHVYLPPVQETTVRNRGQVELDCMADPPLSPEEPQE